MSPKICRVLFLSLCVWVISIPLAAQDNLADKLRDEVNEAAIADVTVDEFAWIAGHWRGEAFGGIAEEIWAPPQGGAMVGMFRLSNDEGISLYELMTIGEQDGVFMLRLKHFSAQMHAWETKEETVDFVFTDRGENIWYFDGMTIERPAEGAMTLYVLLGSKEGDTNIVPFRYKRVD